MEHSEFHRRAIMISEKALDVLKERNDKYSRTDNPLANFEETAEFLGLSEHQALLPHLHKHYRALINSLNEDSPSMSAVLEHVTDIINYCIIAYIILENQNNEALMEHEALMERKAYYERPGDDNDADPPF